MSCNVKCITANSIQIYSGEINGWVNGNWRMMRNWERKWNDDELNLILHASLVDIFRNYCFKVLRMEVMMWWEWNWCGNLKT